MIPKIIHYCWFGGNPIPEKDKEYIESWKKFCPDYEIKLWNESNYDITKNKYMHDAYINKKWGFVPDYARLDIIYNYGGIYLDTDVELVKSLDDLLENKAYMGFESEYFANFGVGFGAEKGHPGIKKLLDMYEELEFVKPDGSLNLTPSPILNSDLLKIYPSEYFCPMNYGTGLFNPTQNTYSIHHYNMSWMEPHMKRWHYIEQRITRITGRAKAKKIIKIISFPDRVYRKLKKLGLKGTIKFAMAKLNKSKEV